MNTVDAIAFWSKVDKTGPAHPVLGTPCWVWTAGRSRGYGSLRTGGRTMQTHRVAWELTNGPIPGGMSVLHRCDNPPCCNPAHHFVGTQTENMRDMDAKGRRAPIQVKAGAANGRAKLDDGDVAAIRRLHATGGWSQRKLAERFGVSQSLIGHVVRGLAWKLYEVALEAIDGAEDLEPVVMQ